MIKQAVIFCGGFGTRLQKITNKIPKPMVDVAGKPFLEHLIVQLKKNGIKKIIILTGYKSDLIKNYFLDGRGFNLNIEYSYLPANYETGSRLYKVIKKLNKKFLLLYCDNYSSINIHKLNKEFLKSKKKLMMCLSEKKNGNCSINRDMTVNYSLKRSSKNKFVEIGYMIIKKEILRYLKNKNESFSKFIYQMSKKKFITSFIQKNGYTSIGDPKRLNITRKLFLNNKFILIDRDGVLNVKSKTERYITSVKNLILNRSLCSKLPKNSKLICISNQAGISTKDLTFQNLRKINNKISKYLKSLGIQIVKYYISHHHYNSQSYFRKPNPGNFFKASNNFKFILDKTFYIGDDKRDIEAAYNANTFIIYVGKDKLTLTEKKKYNFVMLKNSIKYVYNEKKKYRF